MNKVLRASNNHEKEYIVTVDRAIDPDFIRKMSNGVPVLGTQTKKCFVRQEGGRRFRIILTQGLNGRSGVCARVPGLQSCDPDTGTDNECAVI